MAVLISEVAIQEVQIHNYYTYRRDWKNELRKEISEHYRVGSVRLWNC